MTFSQYIITIRIETLLLERKRVTTKNTKVSSEITTIIVTNTKIKVNTTKLITKKFVRKKHRNKKGDINRQKNFMLEDHSQRGQRSPPRESRLTMTLNHMRLNTGSCGHFASTILLTPQICSYTTDDNPSSDNNCYQIRMQGHPPNYQRCTQVHAQVFDQRPSLHHVSFFLKVFLWILSLQSLFRLRKFEMREKRKIQRGRFSLDSNWRVRERERLRNKR